jgi:Na+/melibiose symporter-like transporter
MDPVGQLLVLVMLASLTYGIIEGPNAGWTAPEIIGCFALAAAALAGLLGYEPRRAEPLLELRFFRSAPFSGAAVLAVCTFAGTGGFLFLNTLYLQDVRGFSALHAGLYLLPMAAMTVVFSPLAGRLVASRGPRAPLAVAGIAMTAGSLLFVRLSADTPAGWLVAGYLVFGIGLALVNPPITNSAVSGMPAAQGGLAAAITSTSRQVGQALGVAVIGSAVVSRLHAPLSTGFAEASRAGWWIISGCGLAVLLVGVLTTGRWARATAATVAAHLDAPPVASSARAGP